MNIYLRNVLRGFISTTNEVELGNNMRETPEFLIVDLDKDDMPEIVVCFTDGERNYIGIFKRIDGNWELVEIREDGETENEGFKTLLVSTENKEINVETIGEKFNLEDVFGRYEARFISIINGDFYYGRVKKDEKKVQEVIDLKQADVYGSGLPDTIYLLGNRPYGEASQLVEDIKLVINDGSTNQSLDIKLPIKKGYYPTIFLEDFTGDKRKDILVTVYTGEEGGGIESYLYTFEKNTPILIFDSSQFNEKSTGLVEYQDNYKVKIKSNNPKAQYTLDVSDKTDEYLTSVYDEDGNLLKETSGEILGLNTLNPVDYQKSGIYNLDAIQRIIGPDSSITLGLLETFLVWDRVAKEFKPFIQYVSLYGNPLE